MSSCSLGHTVIPGTESCAECGEDVRVRCSGGHASRAGKRFCETCGEFLPLVAPGQIWAAAPALDYSSGSFSEFIAGSDDDHPSMAMSVLPEPAPREPAQAPRQRGLWEPLTRQPETAPGQRGLWEPATRQPEPALREPEPALREPEPALREPERAPWGPDPATRQLETAPGQRGLWEPARAPGRDGGADHDVTPRMPGAADVAIPAPETRRPRRNRLLVLALLVAVCAVGGTAGALALHHHYAAGITAPARPAAAASPAQPVSSSGWSSPFPVTPVQGTAVISGISCPTPKVCYAVDSAGAILSSTPPGGWSKVATDPAGDLVAISCATKTSCVALDHSGNALLLANGAWSSPSSVDAGVGVFTGLSCPSATFCMATTTSTAYAETSAGWQQVKTSGGRLTGVSCTSAKYCVAVDKAGGVHTYDGTSWTAASAVDTGHAFTAVSCPDRSFCAAIDASGNAAVFSGGKWSVSPLGTTALSLACPVAGTCVAGNRAGGAMVYSGGAWSHASVDGTAAIGSLSCSSATFCVAIDRRGEVVYYRPE